MNVSSVNEKIKITDTSGDITAESINGAITMTGIDSKSVEASTVNGTIVYEGKLADGGRYTFGTHNGDLLLGVPENANATFTIRTYQGSFSTDLPLAGVSRADLERGRRGVTTLGNGSADVSLETFDSREAGDRGEVPGAGIGLLVGGGAARRRGRRHPALRSERLLQGM